MQKVFVPIYWGPFLAPLHIKCLIIFVCTLFIISIHELILPSFLHDVTIQWHFCSPAKICQYLILWHMKIGLNWEYVWAHLYRRIDLSFRLLRSVQSERIVLLWKIYLYPPSREVSNYRRMVTLIWSWIQLPPLLLLLLLWPESD